MLTTTLFQIVLPIAKSVFMGCIVIIDLVRYRSEGELPYRLYSDALH